MEFRQIIRLFKPVKVHPRTTTNGTVTYNDDASRSRHESKKIYSLLEIYIDSNGTTIPLKCIWVVNKLNIDERLKALMDERGLNMYSLAKRSNLSWNTINNLFAKKSKPTITTLEMVCKGLGITLIQFFDVTGKTVSLTAEQEHLVGRWNTLTPQEKSMISELIDYMVQSKSERE